MIEAEQRLCSVDGCSRKHYAKDACKLHYKRFRKNGSYNLPTDEDRFWDYVDVRGPSECWPWTAQISTRGYGAFRFNGRQGYAHRYSFMLCNGEIPDGLEIDHMCHNDDTDCRLGDKCEHRRCVNPAHLRAVTHSQNMNDGKAGLHHGNPERGMCMRGHTFDTVWRNGGRWQRACKRCHNEYEKKARVRRIRRAHIRDAHRMRDEITNEICELRSHIDPRAALHPATVADAVDAALLLLTRAAGLEAAGDDRVEVLDGLYTAAKHLASLRHQGVGIAPDHLAGFRDAIRWAHTGPR